MCDHITAALTRRHLFGRKGVDLHSPVDGPARH
jgi:hypothetical protein